MYYSISVEISIYQRKKHTNQHKQMNWIEFSFICRAMHIERYGHSIKSTQRDEEEDTERERETVWVVNTMTPLYLHRPKMNTMNTTKISKQCTADVKCAYLYSILLIKSNRRREKDRDRSIVIIIIIFSVHTNQTISSQNGKYSSNCFFAR